MAEVPSTSTTLLRDLADLQHARWAAFLARYRPMKEATSRLRLISTPLVSFWRISCRGGAFYAEGSNVTMRLTSCIARNRAAEPLGKVGINYDLQDGAGLDLPELDEPDDHGRRYIERSGSPTRLTFKKAGL